MRASSAMTDGRQWDITVVGGANTDYMVRGPELPAPGTSVVGDVFIEAPGGKGVNQAAAAARLGSHVALVARVGGDARGQAVIDGLVADGVDTRFIYRDPDLITGVALIQVAHRGEKQILIAPGANHALTLQDVRVAAPAITGAALVVAQLEVPLDAVLEAGRLTQEAGAQMALDVSPPRTLPRELLRRLDLVRGNTREAETLTGVRVTDRASARAAAERMISWGARIAVVQAGDAGDLVLRGEDEVWLPRILLEGVDATGAGDTFMAAIATALVEGWPLERAGRFASVAAALATTVFGARAGLPRRAAVLELLDSFDARADVR
ncbi:MAG: ribokinase [Chloroflexi bacterium]|nr:ribokinase [Chloroflexota bacterium]